MGTLNDWAGTIGGTILCIELIVLVTILLAINAGLFFGLRWVLRKTDWAHTKIAWALGLVTKIVDRGAGYAAAPVIVGTSTWRGLKAGLHRATHWPKSQSGALVLPAKSPPAPKDGTRAA